MNLVSISRGGAGDWLHGAGINLARIHSASFPTSMSRFTSFMITVYFSSCDAFTS